MHRNKVLELLNSYKENLSNSGRSSVATKYETSSSKSENTPSSSISTPISSRVSELQEVDTVLDFIKNNKDCFMRENSKGHLTGSAWLLNPSCDKALLMHHKKLKLWLQPGGHADGDSDLLSVAIKEAQEESGILDIEPVKPEIFDVDIHWVDHNCPHGYHYHYDIRFLLRATKTEKFVQNHESLGLKWMGIDELLSTPQEASVQRLTKKWQLCFDEVLAGN